MIVHVRRPGGPEEPSDDRAASAAGPPTERPTGPLPPADPLPLSFRVATWVVVTKFALAAVFAVTALLAGADSTAIIAALAAVGLAVYGLRDVLARERLRVDSDGLTVIHGFARRGRLGWDRIERVRLNEQSRLGVRIELLEVDAGDWIGLYGRHELGAEPEAVAAAIDAVRPHR